MVKVAIIKCESYEENQVLQAMEKGLELLGGIEQFVKKDEKIVLKPNILVGDPPEKCTTTHPSVLKAAAQLFIKSGAKVSYGDSPAFGSTLNAAKKAGLQKVADELGMLCEDFNQGKEVFYENGKQNKKFKISKPVLNCDGLISLPKLKSHGFEKLTCCIKNQFGCVPGTLKGEFHVKVPDSYDFAKMLVDLDQLVHPRLYIVDGITAMEGNGPRGGNPKQMNMLLLSKDPVALDATICRLINLDPGLVPTIQYGKEFGRGEYEADQIEIVGEKLENIKTGEFNIDRTPLKPFKKSGLFRFFSNRLLPKPVINYQQCVNCGICVKMCPAQPKAVDWFDKSKSDKPTYQYNHCIRCFCCQELCPEHAITLKKPFIRRLFSKKK